jgi:hypothetical protein
VLDFAEILSGMDVRAIGQVNVAVSRQPHGVTKGQWPQ